MWLPLGFPLHELKISKKQKPKGKMRLTFHVRFTLYEESFFDM